MRNAIELMGDLKTVKKALSNFCEWPPTFINNIFSFDEILRLIPRGPWVLEGDPECLFSIIETYLMTFVSEILQFVSRN